MRAEFGVLAAAVVLAGAVAAAWAGPTGEDRRLNEIRNRLRAEAGVCDAPAEDTDLPMVPVAVLPGDTHARIALELTGSLDAEEVLRKIEPNLEPGGRIFVPRQLLAPRLADPRLEALTLGQPYPTLWSLAKGVTAAQGPGVAVTVRNLQRLNAIVDPASLPVAAKVLVPRSLLASAPPAVAPPPPLRVRDDFQVTDLKGIERRGRYAELPQKLRDALQTKGLKKRQLTSPEVDLVVIHTTEHRGGAAANVGRYIQRKRLANYFIGPKGEVYEIVPETHRAHGCGQSLWEGRYGVDDQAINIEVYADTAPETRGQGITEEQYAALRALLSQIRRRNPAIHEGRVVTHRMVALNYALGTRSRKGDPFEFDWAKAGLPDNSRALDQDVLVGRAKLCTDERYTDRVTPGQTAAARLQGKM